MINEKVSVISVTFNNAEGIERTLSSLLNVKTSPAEILIVDGGSRDQTGEVIKKFSSLLPLKYFSERDSGIYDAMNKGKGLATRDLVHYLNGGDEVFGDPYYGVTSPCRLPVLVQDPNSRRSWWDRPRLLGFAYTHQGVIFRNDHRDYDLRLKLAADIDLMITEFPNGISSAPVCSGGYVRFYLGGVSSQFGEDSAEELRRIADFRFRAPTRELIKSVIMLKELFPRNYRRYVATRLYRSKASDEKWRP